MDSTRLGLTVMLGIMLHNIPEGIAIAVPYLAARPGRYWEAFWLATASGLAEPVGALIAMAFIRQNDETHGLIEDILAYWFFASRTAKKRPKTYQKPATLPKDRDFPYPPDGRS